jgi:(p)ppGpp synthase/HD superfamily hydrolase
MTLVEKALKIAVVAHNQQVRKSDGSPYIVHPVMVAGIVRKYDFSETACAAALVHDVLEDTDFPRDELLVELGQAVVSIVDAVSEDASLPWEERKEEYVQKVAASGVECKAVSIADKIHNAESLIDSHALKGKEVWTLFNRGKEKKLWFENMLHAEVSKTWEHPLLDRYKELITQMEALEE